MPRRGTKQRHPFRSYRPMNFGGWQPKETHEHDYEIVTWHINGKTIVIDKCKTCPYEAARDLA